MEGMGLVVTGLGLLLYIALVESSLTISIQRLSCGYIMYSHGSSVH
jgi:hypothetical protein